MLIFLLPHLQGSGTLEGFHICIHQVCLPKDFLRKQMESVHLCKPTRFPRRIIMGLNQHKEETIMKEMFSFSHRARSRKSREAFQLRSGLYCGRGDHFSPFFRISFYVLSSPPDFLIPPFLSSFTRSWLAS